MDAGKQRFMLPVSVLNKQWRGSNKLAAAAAAASRLRTLSHRRESPALSIDKAPPLSSTARRRVQNRGPCEELRWRIGGSFPPTGRCGMRCHPPRGRPGCVC